MPAALSEKWDRRFIELAQHIATWSKDPSSKVAAVIVDEHRRVVSVGFNGFPAGVSDEEVPRERKLLRVVHAEVNALAFATAPVRGCTIYVTHPCCAHCAATLIQKGIACVVYPVPEPAFLERWGDHHNEACEMFKEAGVEVYWMPI
jgi:dCMP deaminase